METNQLKAAIEAILFTMGETVELEQLSSALDTDKKEIKKVISQLQEEYSKDDRGLKIIELDDGYQMCTKEFAYEHLIKIVSIPKSYKLTDIQLEALSIIAYKQPITKIEIEKIRGVSSDHAINRLIEAGLVEEVGRLQTPGRPIVFGTTEEFLRRFGLSSLDNLPSFNPDQVETFKQEAEDELNYKEEQAKKAAEAMEREEMQELLEGDADIQMPPEDEIIDVGV